MTQTSWKRNMRWDKLIGGRNLDPADPAQDAGHRSLTGVVVAAGGDAGTVAEILTGPMTPTDQLSSERPDAKKRRAYLVLGGRT